MVFNKGMEATQTVKFTTDKNGQEVAMRLTGRALRTRWVRMNVDEARAMVATGEATQVDAGTASTAGLMR